jgi:hypothetical protein
MGVAAPDDSPLNLTWKITYRGCALETAEEGNLTVTESSERSSVKINFVRPVSRWSSDPAYG